MLIAKLAILYFSSFPCCVALLVSDISFKKFCLSFLSQNEINMFCCKQIFNKPFVYSPVNEAFDLGFRLASAAGDVDL